MSIFYRRGWTWDANREHLRYGAKSPFGEGFVLYHGSTTRDYRIRDWPARRLAEVLFSHQYTYPYESFRLSSLFKSVVSDVSNGKDYSIAKVPPSLSVLIISPGVLVETKPRGYASLGIGTFQIHGSCCPFTQLSVHAPSMFLRSHLLLLPPTVSFPPSLADLCLSSFPRTSSFTR